MILSPLLNFLYEVSLYLKIRVSELKVLFGNDCKYLYSLCNTVYNRFRRRFRKNCRKSRVATSISGENLHKCFSRYHYAWSDLTEIIYRKQNDPGISLLWNCCVNVRVLYLPKKWEKTTWNYLYKEKRFIVTFLGLWLNYIIKNAMKLSFLYPKLEFGC